MSANNFIKINKNHKGKWVVREYDADGGGLMRKIAFETSLVGAIRAANLYSSENEVEYGLEIDL